MITRKRDVRVLLLLVYLSVLHHSESTIPCESDGDCPPDLACRLVCRRTCKSICVSLSPRRALTTTTRLPSTTISKSSEEPFATQGNPFVRSADETPLTISEAELEAELRQVGGPPPPASVFVAPPPFEAEPSGPPSPPQQSGSDGLPPSSNPQPPGNLVGYGDEPSYPNTLTEPPTNRPPSFGGREHPPQPLLPPRRTQLLPPPPNTREHEKPPPAPPTPPLIPDPPGIPSGDLQALTTTAAIPLPPNNVPHGPPGLSLVPDLSPPSSAGAQVPKLPFPTLVSSQTRRVSTTTRSPSTISTTLRSTSRVCPPPRVCGKNCGIYIGDDGCQTCQCLWFSSLCHIDSDCDADGQFCELGRCQCAHGFIQDMERSGLCKADPVFTKAREKALSEADQWRPQPKKVVKPELRKPPQPLPPVQRRPWGRWPVSKAKRHRRAAHLPTKPHREERLQWPGPCDADAQCPPNLYCIQGDCWHIPEKPLRQFHSMLFEKNLGSGEQKSFPNGTEVMPTAQLTTVITSDTLFPLHAELEDVSTTSLPSTISLARHLDEEVGPPSILPPPEYLATSAAPITGFPSVSPITFEDVEFAQPTRPPREFSDTRRRVNNAFRGEVKPIAVDEDKEFEVRQQTRRPLPPPRFSDYDIPPENQRSPPQESVEPLRQENLQPLPQEPLPVTQRSPVVFGQWQEMTPPPTFRRSNFDSSFTRVPSVTRAPSLTDGGTTRIFWDYSIRNRRRKPVRVEMVGAKHLMRDECRSDHHCGQRYMCCLKRWCDISNDCGSGRFCLPDCELTKMTYLSSLGIGGVPLIDLVYD